MRAALLEEMPGDLVVSEVELTDIGPDEVRVRTVACGLCHSDLHVMEGKTPHPMPSLLGHEAAGIVEAVGADVDEFTPGDHVVGCLNAHCSRCIQCTAGRTFLCENRRALQRRADGTSRVRRTRDGVPEEVNQMAGLGGFGEMMLAHRSALAAVPRDLPLELGALLGCAVITGVGAAFNTARVQAGSTVAVVGVGGIGLNIIQGARLAGAERIIAVDVNAGKAALAATFGATDFVDARSHDPVAAVTDLTAGGADTAFEAIGLAVTAEQAFQMLRAGGMAYLVGLSPQGTNYQFNGNDMVIRSRGVQGVFMGSNHFKRDIPMLANLYLQGRLKLDELVSARISLGDINDGFREMRTGTVARSVVIY
jgi:S-(hydroxymethyl)glutathione dehydrogenase / alcohol dehydrogenase